MKKIGFLALVLLSVFSCIKKPVEELVDIPPVTYTIKGTLYNEDGVTPLANTPIELLAYKTGGSIYSSEGLGILGTRYTTNGGYFSFTYSHIPEKTGGRFLMLSGGSTALPAGLPYLKEIPLNQNIERDICTCRFGIFDIIVDDKYLLMGDTLFISHGDNSVDAGFSFINTTTDKSKLLGLKREWDKSYKESFLGGFWGIGRQGYEEALQLSREGKTSPKGAQLKGTLRGFPYRDILKLE